jgi:hypothetical protein
MHAEMGMPEVHTGPVEIKEIAVAYVDNGFIVRAAGPGIHKTYVIQAESEDPEEIESVLDVIRTIHHQAVKGKSHGFGRAAPAVAREGTGEGTS